MITRELSILLVLILNQPGSVITREEKVGILDQFELLQFVDNATTVEIDFLHGISIESSR